MQTLDLTKTLSYNYVFRGVPAGAINTLAALADTREFRGGDVLVRQFEKSQDVFILLEGRAVTRSFDGSTLAEFGPGSIVGEMALIDGEVRCATITAVGRCVAAVIPAGVIRSLMEMDADVSSAIYGNMAKVLCRRLRTMNAAADNRRAVGVA